MILPLPSGRPGLLGWRGARSGGVVTQAYTHR
jgi:hypothetical protein